MTTGRKKLERLYLASHFIEVLYCRVSPEAYPSGKYLKGLCAIGVGTPYSLLAFTTNNRLGWKGVLGKDTVAYYKHL